MRPAPVLTRRALVLPELVAVLAVAAVLAAALFLSAAEARRQGGLGDDLAHFAQHAAATGAYAADNDDLMWGFSWRQGVDYGFGGAASDDAQAAANQAVDIIRRRAGRTDIAPITGWLPNIGYSQLVLVDYLDGELPSRMMVSSADRKRLLWQADPEEGFYALGPLDRPYPLGDDNASKRWPYSSSFSVPPAFWSRDAAVGDQQTVQQQPGTYTTWQIPTGAMIGRRLSEIAHPGQKVMMHDVHQRHFGPREAYFAYPEARVPVLMADGSALVRRTGDANIGFTPNLPTLLTPLRCTYEPTGWEPRALSGGSGDFVFSYYRFTRSGLRGRDFNAPEVPWTD